MKLRKKLLLVFMVLASFVGIIGYFSIKSLKEINNDVDQIRLSSILEVESSAEMSFELVLMGSLLKEYLSEKANLHHEGAGNVKKEIEACFFRFEKQIQLRKRITSDGFDLYATRELDHEKEELQEIIDFESKYQVYKKDIIEMMAGFDKQGYIRDFKLHEHEWDSKVRLLLAEATSFKKEAQEEISAEASNVSTEAGQATKIVIMIAILSFLAALVVGVFGAKSLITPLLELKAAAHNIALGNMEMIKDIKTKDEIADLAVSFNVMTTELKKNRSQIEEYSRTLERKVHDRTKDLEEIIGRLTETEEKLTSYTNDLKNSNLELEQFAYVASHDLQEPLRTILSFVELLHTQYKGKLDARADKYLTYIEQSSTRMKTLIHDLLDYSKIGNKKELQEVDCNTVLQEVKDDLHKKIADEEAVIETQQLPVISGYRTEMKQLFQNLILNAIKFRTMGTIPKINISVKKDEISWTFGVRDNGIGIAPEHRERIFTIFQRLHSKAEYEGSGIGLAHCKKIIGLHRGKIWIESIPGEGTTFYFNIPLNNN